jgi:FAD/FMN-containing dehydrogenase
LVLDAAIAQSVAQGRAFWALRENIAEAQGAAGKTIKHDVALPISHVAQFLAQANAAVTARWPNVRFVTSAIWETATFTIISRLRRVLTSLHSMRDRKR